MLSPVACPAVPYFSTLSHKGRVFRGRIIKHKINVLIFSTNFETQMFWFSLQILKHKCFDFLYKFWNTNVLIFSTNFETQMFRFSLQILKHKCFDFLYKFWNTNVLIFSTKFETQMFWFSLQILKHKCFDFLYKIWNFYHPTTKWARYDQTCIFVFT